MNDDKQFLLDQVERDRDRLVGFLSRFVQTRTPNPPGDTRAAVAFVKATLEAEGAPCRVIDPKPEFPNLVGSFEGTAPGRHLVLNGHIDVFPVGEHERWTHPPWSGAVADGRIWGRGVADMKCGTTSSIWTYIYLHRLRDRLKGRLTLTAVSDEENFGPWGARYLMEHHPEVHGDCCLNGEPSSPWTIRFGEKGPLWLRFTIDTRGGHGAYTHATDSATRIAARLIGDLETLEDLDTPAPGNIGAVLTRSKAEVDKALGAGAADIAHRITLNIGQIHGGLKVNTIPGQCVLEADVRFPVGLDRQVVSDAVAAICARHPQVTMEEINFQPPSWCDPEHEMVGILQDNVERLRGFRPAPVISLGGTDTRLWRYRDIPAYVYGPSPTGMGSGDEQVPVEDFLHVLRTHLLSAWDYLTR